jgi:site-specific DNA-cytosine methylase
MPAVPCSKPRDAGQFPRCDVVLLGDECAEWARAVVLACRPRAVLCEKEFTDDWLGGEYERFEERLNAHEFGVPQDRPSWFSVSFRKDAVLSGGHRKFLTFPFPEPGHDRKVLGDVLESRPDLVVAGRTREYVEQRDKRARERGYRYRCRLVGRLDPAPFLSRNYSHDKLYWLADAPEGPRTVSVLEAKRIMGFPDDWTMGLHDGRAMFLLGGDVCPPVARALVAEVADWVY